MRLPRAVLLSIFVVPFLLQGSASSQIVTITAKGNIYNGGDSGGVFGAAGASLRGEPFVIVMTFDSSKGKIMPEPFQCSPQGCTSQSFGQREGSLGTAELTIKGTKYVFGNALEPGPTPAANIWSKAGKTITKQSNFQTVAFSFAVNDHTGRVGIGPGLIKTLESTLDPDWRTPFCETNLAKGQLWNSEFEIHNSRVQANGYLAVDILSVGDCSPEVPNDCQGLAVPGDVVLYKGHGDFYYKHAAIIADDGVVIDRVHCTATVTSVISKWGDWGIYETDPDDTPYGTEWTVWHKEIDSRNHSLIKRTRSEGRKVIEEWFTTKDRWIRNLKETDIVLSWSQAQAQIEQKCPGLFAKGYIRPDPLPSKYSQPEYWRFYDCRGWIFAPLSRIGDKDPNIPFRDQVDNILQDNGYHHVSAQGSGGHHSCAPQ